MSVVFPNRIVEIYDLNHVLITSYMHCNARPVKAGGKAPFIDAEHALDPVYAKNLGVDVDDLLVSQPDTGEQALEICDITKWALREVILHGNCYRLCGCTQRLKLWVIWETQCWTSARLMSQALRKISAGNR